MADMEADNMAREMTPQERSEQLYGSLTCTTYREGYQDPDNDIALIADVLQQTRRAALLEVAELHQEWRNGKHSGTFSDLLRHKLAQEG